MAGGAGELSAGILLYRRVEGRLEVLLAHPGGPFYARKDAGVWTIPKGLVDPGEAAEDAACRELAEETGVVVERGAARLVDLGEVRTSRGKRVRVWAVEGDADPHALRSNTFELEWPPRSGRRASFPEVDRLGWFTLEAAAAKITPSQAPLLERLAPALEG